MTKPLGGSPAARAHRERRDRPPQGSQTVDPHVVTLVEVHSAFHEVGVFVNMAFDNTFEVLFDFFASYLDEDTKGMVTSFI